MSSKPETYFLGATIVTVGLSQSISYLNSLKTHSFVLHELALGSLLIQWLVFIHASGILGNPRTEKYYDLTGSLTFISLILWSIISIPNVFNNGGFMNISLRQLIASSFVLIWACRLGSFLFSRSLRDGGIDSRFTEYKKNIYRFATCWTIQALWPFLCALPVFIINTIPSPIQSSSDTATAVVYHDNAFINTLLSFLYQQQSQLSSLKITDYVGISLWFFGFIFEITADEQKRLFRLQQLSAKNKQLQNHHSFIHTGVWSFSRHPNYFGEICVWSGIFLLCTGGYTYNTTSTDIWSWLDWQSIIHTLSAFLSPLFTFTLLVFVSGIPLLEQAGNKKWGEDVEYKRYKQTTPVLIPLIGRRGNAAF